MGLFFNRKKNKPKNEEKNELHKPIAEAVYLDTPKMGPDMVSLIKNEQEELINPFSNENEQEDNSAKSVAKRYGTKYAGIKGRQLASSKVVDVRSYVKPEEKPEQKEKTTVEKELEEIERQKEEKQSASKSFFDDILKSIEEDVDNDQEEEPVEIPEPEPKPEVKVEEPKPIKKESKKPTKKKKSIDIDIISGDFGGSDIL